MMLCIMIRVVFFRCFALLFSVVVPFTSCSTQYYFFISHDIHCNNCNLSDNDAFDVDMGSKYSDSDFIKLIIKNPTDEPILLDLKSFSITKEDSVIYHPIGIESPYIARSLLNISGIGFSYKAPYYYIPFIGLFDKYAYQSELLSGVIFSEIPKEYITIPAYSKTEYPIINSIQLKFVQLQNTPDSKEAENKLSHTELELKYQSIYDILKSDYENTIIKIHLYHKKLNAEKWVYTILEYRNRNIILYFKDFKTKTLDNQPLIYNFEYFKKSEEQIE